VQATDRLEMHVSELEFLVGKCCDSPFPLLGPEERLSVLWRMLVEVVSATELSLDPVTGVERVVAADPMAIIDTAPIDQYEIDKNSERRLLKLT
jgi:hypothetical protein